MNILNRVYIGKYYIKELHTNIEISKKYLKYKNNMLK